MHARKSQQHPHEKSRELQRRLYRAAKRSGSRRFHALYDRIVRPDILWRAWEEVKANRGSAGVDGVSLEDVEQLGVEGFLDQLATDLKEGRYRPKPVLRVEIPKPDGRKRPLGIPTVRDRIVQQACRLVIEPIFEADFWTSSYGFRPRRDAGEAVKRVKESLVRGWWVVDADIQDFFGAIDHEILMRLLRRRISDRRVLKLIQQWLAAGVVEEGQWRLTDRGTPQGGVISPLLANVYLDVLDSYWEQNCQGLGEYVRYADDFVIVCREPGEAEEALRRVRRLLEELKLPLHPVKTQIVRMGEEGFDFLGFHFHKRVSIRSRKLVPYAWPSQKAMKSARGKIKELTRRSEQRTALTEVVSGLNRVIRGWRNYFQIGSSTKKFQELDRYVRFRLWKTVQARQGMHRSVRSDKFDEWHRRSGIESFYQPGRCGVASKATGEGCRKAV